MPLTRPGWSLTLVTQVLGSFAFRVACYGLMLWLALWAEARPAPRLPDLVLEQVPYVPWVDRYNYVLWLAAYVPIALWLLWEDARRFIRYMVSSGLLALVRGVCIVATGLGPVRGEDLHAGMSYETRLGAFQHLFAPAFFSPSDGAGVYLTKDLFFSGHTATTLLLLLYVWRYPRLRWLMLGAHLLVVASLFFAHLHYTIDVIGAYAVTLALFALREGKLDARA